MASLSDLFTLSALERPVDRRTYFNVGVSLMVLKYTVDAAAIWWTTGITWTPIDYLVPLYSFTGVKIARFPTALNVFLLCWALVFIWIGVTMSARRALDAGILPWIVVFFFIPFLNYLLMLSLAAVPTAWVTRRDLPSYTEQVVPDTRRRTQSTVLGILAGAGTGVVMATFAVMALRTYGGTVFLLTPFLMGAVSAFVANTIAPRERSETVMIGMAGLGLIGGTFILFALEGVICLAMAVPLAVPLQIMGSFVGHLIGTRQSPPATTISMVLLLLVPAGPAVDASLPAPPPRIVMTSIEVNAPPEEVWTHVVSFTDITTAPGWQFRTGLAYPRRARIDGTGAGAIRHCEFTTGAFVEPITVWEEPRRLAFDVAAQPPPLHEWSPYSRVYAPHLDGFFRTTHGEFRLIPLEGGRTRLEGRTWYVLRMQPAMYWNTIADSILHAIHQRVLEHVKDGAEHARR